jgi:hypothetical protein
MALERIEEVPSFKMDGTEYELMQIPEGPGRSSVKTYLELKRSVSWTGEVVRELNNTIVELLPSLKQMIEEPQTKERILKGPKEWAIMFVASLVTGASGGLIEYFLLRK